MADEPTIIRSYRRIFHVDRRLYKIQEWTIPVPGGIPLLAVGYFAVTLLAVLIIGVIPGLGELMALLSPPLRYVVLPLAVAVLGTQVAPDGRKAHRFAGGWLALRVRRRRRSAGRAVALDQEPHPWQATLAVARDAHGPQLRAARISGPAIVRFSDDVEVTRPRRHGPLRVRPLRPTARRPARVTIEDCVELDGDQRLEVRPR